MLAALLENNNNTRAVQQPRLPQVKIDRGGGGPSWPSYEIVDIITATAAFPEIAGEDTIARAVRRQKWIGDTLPFIKTAREKREGAAFLVGAQLADRAVREEFTAAEKLSIEQLTQIIDDVRGTAVSPMSMPRVQQVRGVTGGMNVGGVAIVLGLVLGGVLIGRASAGMRKRRRW